MTVIPITPYRVRRRRIFANAPAMCGKTAKNYMPQPAPPIGMPPKTQLNPLQADTLTISKKQGDVGQPTKEPMKLSKRRK